MADTVTADTGSEKRCYTVKEIQMTCCRRRNSGGLKSEINIVFQRTVLMNGWIDRQGNR